MCNKRLWPTCLSHQHTQMCDCQKYRMGPDVICCCAFFQEHMKYVFIIVLFPLLAEIIPVPHVFDDEAQGNNKARKCVAL